MSTYLDDIEGDDATLLVVEAGGGAGGDKVQVGKTSVGSNDGGGAAAGPDPADDPVTSFVYVLAGFSAIGGLLFGYDIGVIGGVMAMDNFRTTMGLPLKLDAGANFTGTDADADDPATNNKLGWIAATFSIGCGIGSFFSGMVADRCGRRTAISLGGASYTLGAVMEAGSGSIPFFVFGRLIAGLGVGCLSCIVPLYTAEMSPARVRGRLNSNFQLMLTVGILMAFTVNYFSHTFRTGWRTSLGVSAAFSAVLSIGMVLFSESPRWLLKQGRKYEAERTLNRVYPGSPAVVSREMLALTAALAAEAKQPEATWAEVFSPEMRRRLLIGWGTQFNQQLTGINVIMIYSVVILSSTGISEYVGTIVIGVVNVLSTFVAMRLIDARGRKWLLLTGAAVMCACFVLAGLLITTCSPEDGGWASYAVGICICMFVVGFGATWGPVSWVVGAEIYPERVRGKALSVTTALGNWFGTFLITYLSPFVLSGLGTGGTFFLFAGLLFEAFLFTLFIVPETKGIPLGEIEAMFVAGSTWASISKSSEWVPSFMAGVGAGTRAGGGRVYTTAGSGYYDGDSDDDDDDVGSIP